MPRGVPVKGHRAAGAGRPRLHARTDEFIAKQVGDAKTDETDEQIKRRLNTRFKVVEELTNTVIAGKSRALIISGPAGVGKSYLVEQALKKKQQRDYGIIKGYVRATGLFETLYNYRRPNQVVVFDDADYILTDAVCLNMLKAVCDTSLKRTVSYLSKFELTDSNGFTIPGTFEFQGSIVFVTNLDFDAMIAKQGKLAPHLSALISRAHYIDLEMTCKRDYLVRVRQVAVDSLFKAMPKKNRLTPKQKDDVLKYVDTNLNKIRELSLRMIIKLAELRKERGRDWRNVADVTCLKRN